MKENHSSATSFTPVPPPVLEWRVWCSSIVVLLVWRIQSQGAQLSLLFSGASSGFMYHPRSHNMIIYLPGTALSDAFQWQHNVLAVCFGFSLGFALKCLSFAKCLRLTVLGQRLFTTLVWSAPLPLASTGLQVYHMFTIVQTSTLFYGWPEGDRWAMQRINNTSQAILSPSRKHTVRIYTFKGCWT